MGAYLIQFWYLKFYFILLLFSMDNLYKVLEVPTKENLRRHFINYFDKVIEKYPNDYKEIIGYINDCFNYKSPLLVEEKDWGSFLKERFEANELPGELKDEILNYKCPEIVTAIDDFLTEQKQTLFQTLMAKQNLRKDMLGVLQGVENKISDKQTANTLVTTLDDEINSLYEKLRAEQKVFGNYKGFDAVKQAKAAIQISISQFVS